jgi:hypothetical protein
LALRLILLDAAFLVSAIALYAWLGLSLEWSRDESVGAAVLALLLGLWLYFHFVPGTATECLIAEVIFVLVLTIVFVNIALVWQYGAVALRSPYADPWLAAADARLGFYVPALVLWTNRHPAIYGVLRVAYLSLTAQFALAIFGLGALREREGLWEFAFHFQVCLAISLMAFALWPAVHAPAYYGYQPGDMTRLIQQIKGFHDGSMTIVKVSELEGLVSFPSFHVAGGLIVTWAFRRHPRILLPVVVLNIAMVASTFMGGVHYVIDVVGSVPTVAVSLVAYRWWGKNLYQSSAFRVALLEGRRCEETPGQRDADERPADLEQVAAREP